MEAEDRRQSEERHKRPGAPELDADTSAENTGSRPSTHARRADQQKRSATYDIVALAWPICAAMLGETVIGIVDTFLVAGLGKGAIGGVGLATTFMFLSYSFVYGLMRGVKIRASHAFGEGRRDATYAILAAGMGAGLVLGAFVFLFGRDAGWLFTLTKADPEIVPFGREFLRAITWGAPATCALAALIQHRQAIGDSRSPMVVQLAGNLFHGIAGYGLIYGKFGLPALGVVGAGYATTVTEMLEFAVLFALALRDGRGLVRQALRGARRALSEILEVGASTGIQFVLEVFAFTALTSILGSIASTEIAAHQIALMVLRGSFLPGIAISEAACVLVGQSLGARDEPRVMVIARAGLKLGEGFMTTCGVLFAIFGRKIAGAFTDDVAVVTVATHLLWVAAAFQVLDAISIVLRGVLRGAKDATFVAVAGVLISFLTIPTCAYFFGVKCGMGAVGGWLGFVAETALAAPILYARLRRAPWRPSLAAAASNEAEHQGETREAA